MNTHTDIHTHTHIYIYINGPIKCGSWNGFSPYAAWCSYCTSDSSPLGEGGSYVPWNQIPLGGRMMFETYLLALAQSLVDVDMYRLMIISQYLTIIWINHDSGTNSTALSFTKWESLPFSPRSGGRTRRSAPTSAANGAAPGTPTGTVARRPMGRRWRRWAPYGTCAWACSWYHGGTVVPSQVVVFWGLRSGKPPWFGKVDQI